MPQHIRQLIEVLVRSAEGDLFLRLSKIVRGVVSIDIYERSFLGFSADRNLEMMLGHGLELLETRCIIRFYT